MQNQDNQPNYQGYGQPPQHGQPGLFDQVSQSFSNLHVGDRFNNISQHAHLHHHGPPGQVVCGPLLKYIDIDYTTRVWRGSILLVSTDTHAPPIEIHLTSNNSNQASNVIKPPAKEIDSYRHKYRFWRYDIRIVLTDVGQVATYSTPHQNWAAPSFNFNLPAYFESMRFMFYSCNGFSDIPQEVKDKYGEKDAPLWQDVLDRHEVLPFHVLLGGGDQLYQDRLIKEEFMIPWNEEKDPAKRLAMKLDSKMISGFEEFYFSNYCKNFGFDENPVVAKAFATIPSMNMWDDHDIIDGYGSYPADMQNAHCFTVLFENACRFYYLFQHHTTVKLATTHGMYRGKEDSCNHIVSTLGPDIGFLSLDCRGERNKHKICSDYSYNLVCDLLQTKLPETVKHLLVVTGVPLIYPRLTFFENLMDGMANFTANPQINAALKGQVNKWNGEPELLDDMNDHWTAANHEEERKTFIERLQQFARERSIRVSFLGGDVHCCGAGKLFSKDMKEKEEGDHNLMVQIISSAIVNVPPPQALLTVINNNSKYYTFNGNTEERMFNLFKRSPNGNTRNNKKLMGMRNYCAGYYDESNGKINFWIQAEKEVGVKGTMGYLVDVPRLLYGQSGYHLYHQDKKQLLDDTYNSYHRHQQPQHPNYDGQGHDHHHLRHLQDAVGGFIMPNPNN